MFCQVFMPLFQGLAWTLIVSGWRYANRSTKFSGQTVGAKVRRWWWGVNNWAIPDDAKGSLRSEKKAADVQDYFTTKLASAGDD
jgi:hypothetical protein